jgi:hypothetical protein
MAVETTKKRITYPLSVKEVEELQALEANLKQKADAAMKANRPGLHRAYTQLLKSTTTVVTRERNRMGREALAQYNKAQRELQRLAKSSPAQQEATEEESSTS